MRASLALSRFVIAAVLHSRVPRRGAGPTRLRPPSARPGWRLLFDGKTFNGWRGLGYDSVPTAHWKIVNGAIKKIASGKVAKMPDGQPAERRRPDDRRHVRRLRARV